MAAFTDVRRFIDLVDDLGELRTVKGAHWDLEIGGITELAQHQINGPAVLFDDIPDYPSGYRVFINSMGSANRTALVLGLPTGNSFRELLPLWRERSKHISPIPMRYVNDGPVMENVLEGDQIDMYAFPTPKWHELDGGRYIGTGSFDVTLDPDGDWINLGCYRVMVLGRDRLGFYISPGKHGRIMRDSYFARGKPMPVLMSFGHDPSLFLGASVEVPANVCEYEYVGGIKGEPVEVMRGKVTGLPYPADAEIVVEGFAYPAETSEEGPFGEWTGYYASDHRAEPVLQVKAVYHRNNPIILGSPPGKPPTELTSYRGLMRSALVWEQIEKAGVPDVQSVWCHEAGGARLLVAVSIKQRYPGHARQAGHIAAMCHAGAYLGRYVVVVDEDIEVTDLNDVVWAMCTRAEPEESFDLIKRAWSGPLDPRIPTARKGHNSRFVIDATRPWEWRDQFPAVAEMSPELRKQITDKWGDLILGTGRPRIPAGV
jgi:4-hydroxy-3-polyprenylbenzoate decarboxylase